MSLKVKCVLYDDVHLSTYQDLEIFSEELRVLIAGGYSICLEVSATNNLLQDGGSSKLPPLSGRRNYELGDYGNFKSYNLSATKQDSANS